MKTLERRRIDEIVRELEPGAYGLALALGLEPASAERILLEALENLAPSLPRTRALPGLQAKLYARIRQRAPHQEWIPATNDARPVPPATVSESLHIRMVDVLEEHQADEPVVRRRAVVLSVVGIALVAGLIAFLKLHADALAAAQPTIIEVDPSATATDVSLSGDVRVKFGRRPVGTPTLRLEPPHATLESVHWDGNTLVAVYSGLHLFTRYQFVLQADYRSRLKDSGHFEKRWTVITQGYPVLSAFVPGQDQKLAPRAGKISINFSYEPPAKPRLTIMPADGILTLGQWSGTTYTASYSGLKPRTQYEATLSLDYGAAAASTERQWSFFTEPGWPASGAPVIWYGTSNLWNAPPDQRLVAIDWQGNLVGTSEPTAVVRQQAPDGSALLTQEGGYVDGNGVSPGVASGYPSMTVSTDDSKGFCRIDGSGQLWLETGPLRGPVRRVASVGSRQAHSWLDLVACSASSDRAVIADDGVVGITAIRVFALSTGRLLTQRSYAPSGLTVISSRDGRYLAESTASYDAQHDQPTGVTVFRRMLDGRVVARLANRRVLQFSWDGLRVVTVPFFGVPDVTLLDWQSGKVLWRQARDQGSDGQPVYAIAQPNGPAMAIAFGDQPRNGEVNQLWIVAADGQATQVVSTVFYPAFGAGF